MFLHEDVPSIIFSAELYFTDKKRKKKNITKSYKVKKVTNVIRIRLANKKNMYLYDKMLHNWKSTNGKESCVFRGLEKSITSDGKQFSWLYWDATIWFYDCVYIILLLESSSSFSLKMRFCVMLSKNQPLWWLFFISICSATLQATRIYKYWWESSPKLTSVRSIFIDFKLLFGLFCCFVSILDTSYGILMVS